MTIRLLLILAVSQTLAAVYAADLDSARGAAIFETQGCGQCHTMNGSGRNAAPDLSAGVDRSYSPIALATTIWNHAPTMWSTIESHGSSMPKLDEQESGDLFAYFYSVRFFESPGDAGRGKHVFEERGCSGCHGLGTPGPSGAIPVSKWTALGDPVILAEAMWNHLPNMRQEMGRRGKKLPHLTTQDLTDLEVYVRNSPEGRGKPRNFMISSSSDIGAALFHSKGCEECHATRIPLEHRLSGLTLTGIAAEMWNHSPLMSSTPAKFEGNEMRELLSYLWARQFFSSMGDPARGRKLFIAKRCSECHDNAVNGAPHLPPPAGKFNGIAMVSALWRHGPTMLGKMRQSSIPWPRLETKQMSDLVAYLNAGDHK